MFACQSSYIFEKQGMNQLLMMTEQLLRLTTYIALSAGESA